MPTRRYFIEQSTLAGIAPLVSIPFFGKSKKEQLRDRAEEGLDGFLDDVDSEHLPEELAVEFCSDYGKLQDEITLSEDELTVHEARKYLRQSEGILERLDERLGASIPVAAVKGLRAADDILKHSSKLIPLFNNIKDILNNCCHLVDLLPDQDDVTLSEDEEKEVQETKVNLLIGAGTLIVEVLAIQLSVTYRISFVGTRLITNRLLVHVREWIGLTLYAALLKEVHWYLRDQISEIVSDTVQFISSITKRIIEMEGCDVLFQSFDRDDLEEIQDAREVTDISEDSWFDELAENLDAVIGSSDGDTEDTLLDMCGEDNPA